MKQIIRIELERPMSEEEIEEYNAWTEEQRQQFIDQCINTLYRFFERDGVDKRHVKEVSMTFVPSNPKEDANCGN